LTKFSKKIAKLVEFTIGKIKIPKMFCLKNHKFCKGKKKKKVLMKPMGMQVSTQAKISSFRNPHIKIRPIIIIT
jgi:hypothetical protein